MDGVAFCYKKCGRRVKAHGLAQVSGPKKEEVLKSVLNFKII